MATYTAKAGGGNWNATGTWTRTGGGTGYPQGGDTAVLNASSGNVVINSNNACAILNCTNYGGTLTQTTQMITTGNVTLSSGMTFLPSPSQPWRFNIGTIDSGGHNFEYAYFNTGTNTLSSPFIASYIEIRENAVLACGTHNVTLQSSQPFPGPSRLKFENGSGTAGYTWSGAQTLIVNNNLSYMTVSTTFDGNTNLNNLTINAGNAVSIFGPHTVAVLGTLNAVGTDVNKISIASNNGTAYMPVTTVGSVEWVEVSNLDSSGGATIHALYSELYESPGWEVGYHNPLPGIKH